MVSLSRYAVVRQGHANDGQSESLPLELPPPLPSSSIPSIGTAMIAVLFVRAMLNRASEWLAGAGGDGAASVRQHAT